MIFELELTTTPPPGEVYFHVLNTRKCSNMSKYIVIIILKKTVCDKYAIHASDGVKNLSVAIQLKRVIFLKEFFYGLCIFNDLPSSLN